ncbi:uncharacterized protein L203_106130 [Cryptococcus depauperatus CBS 7841]|uniref:Uncharacterized protein n=1 Tax=Cryptococcus depauperatus CBS 7841 TaxID=1295531 RepID=A0A1E3IVH2_9TREE|nr:hypothetical protein L203_00837 [Cryptococcus depauperatus CBS 7841]
MAPPEKSRISFQSRFSISSFLPAHHPPLITKPPRMPPTQPGPQHETVVSSFMPSPAHSEHPDFESNYASVLNWDHSQRESLDERQERRACKPPPLDLGRTQRMYPSQPFDLIVSQNALVKSSTDTFRSLSPLASKKRKEDRLIKDPLEVAEAEMGHRYPSWQERKIDLQPGEIIPKCICSLDYRQDFSHNAATKNQENDKGWCSNHHQESVLHDILLTPTYMNNSPAHSSTVSQFSITSNKGHRGRYTFIQKATNAIHGAAKRTSRWMPGKSKLYPVEDASACRSLRPRSEMAERNRQSRHMTKPLLRLIIPKDDQSIMEEEFPTGKTGLLQNKSGWLASIGSREKEIGITGAEDERRMRKRKVWKIGLVLAILIPVSLVIGLCTTLLRRTSSPGTGNSSTTSGNNSYPQPTTSHSLKMCLDLFVTSASNSPGSYPCSDCVPLLKSTTNDFSLPLVNGNSTQVGSALQFCSMMDIFNKIEQPQGLDKWGKDAGPCGWAGVGCDARGRINKLTMKYPNIPSELPGTLGNIYALSALHLSGNVSVPRGQFPSSLLSLPDFDTLDLQHTSLIGPIDSKDFSTAKGLVTLVLVDNPNLGDVMPDLSTNNKLLTVVVTGEKLTNTRIDKLPSSLTYVDLSYNSLSGQVPSFSHLTSLKTLYLTNNDYTSPPSSIPGSLASLSLSSNPKLVGDLPHTICTSTVLTTCDLRKTGLAVASPINSTSSISSLQTSIVKDAPSISPSNSNTAPSTGTQAVITNVRPNMNNTSAMFLLVNETVATASSTPLFTRALPCGICQFS